MNPSCTVFLEAKNGHRFGPFHTEVYLDASWVIRPVNDLYLTLDNDHLPTTLTTTVLVTPIGITRIDCNQRVKKNQPVIIKDMVVTSILGTDTDKLIEAYLNDEIQASDLP